MYALLFSLRLQSYNFLITPQGGALMPFLAHLLQFVTIFA
jgi:hypothetical protein